MSIDHPSLTPKPIPSLSHMPLFEPPFLLSWTETEDKLLHPYFCPSKKDKVERKNFIIDYHLWRDRIMDGHGKLLRPLDGLSKCTNIHKWLSIHCISIAKLSSYKILVYIYMYRYIFIYWHLEIDLFGI